MTSSKQETVTETCHCASESAIIVTYCYLPVTPSTRATFSKERLLMVSQCNAEV